MSGRVLITVVDLDDDLGEAGIETPIIGWDNVLKAALRYVLEHPEDSDANAIFAGLQLYKQLRDEGHDVEICVIGGSARGVVEASFTVRRKLEQVLSQIPDLKGIVLVSDGTEDEQVLPVIQSLVPVLGVKRVVVEQLRGVEETYILIGRYIKKMLVEPRFSRLFLGVPGLIVLSVAVLSVLGLLSYALPVAGLMLGAAMVIRGFNLEDRLAGLWSSSPVMFVAYALSAITLSAALGITYYTFHTKPVTVPVAGDLLGIVSPLLGFSAYAILVGRIVSKMLDKNLRIWYDLLGVVLVTLVVYTLTRLSDSLAALPPNPTPTDISNAVYGSGVVSILLVGMVLIGFLTVLSRIVERMLGEELSGQTSAASSDKSESPSTDQSS